MRLLCIRISICAQTTCLMSFLSLVNIYQLLKLLYYNTTYHIQVSLWDTHLRIVPITYGRWSLVGKADHYKMARWIFAPGTMHFCPRYDTVWPCGLFTLLQFCPPPPKKKKKKKKSVWNPDEKLNCGEIIQECFDDFIITLKLMSFFNNTSYQLCLRTFLSLIFKYTVYHASVTTVTTKSQGDWRAVHCYLHVKILQPITGHAHLEMSHP